MDGEMSRGRVDRRMTGGKLACPGTGGVGVSHRQRERELLPKSQNHLEGGRKV